MIINVRDKQEIPPSGLVIETDQTTVVSGIDCPSLTAEEVTAAYNAVVAGQSVTISHVSDGAYEAHYKAILGDGITGHPSILLPYYWTAWMDYQITAQDTVEVTVHKVPVLPEHQITNVVVGTDTIDITIS